MNTATLEHRGTAYIDDGFDDFAKALHEHFAGKVDTGVPLFTTSDAHEIRHNYLDSFAESLRQTYNCNCCLRFLETYGTLVTIDAFGNVESPFWSIDVATIPKLYRKPVEAMRAFMQGAKVTGVFVTKDSIWGHPITGEWHHMAVKPPASMVHKSRVTTAGQHRAQLREDRGMIVRALAEYTGSTVDTALQLLRTGDTLYRSEKVLGVAEWFAGLVNGMSAVRGEAAGNLLWLAAATAPVGFAHVRSSMIGTLLDDIAEGKSLDDITRSFAAKMGPLQYRRTTAAPTTGGILAAEKLVEKMGIAASLRRRFARMDEVIKIWSPKVVQPAHAGGVFGHLKAAPAKEMVGSIEQTMTWTKFARTLLPTADKIEVCVPGRGNFTAFVTAADFDAPPILQWDFQDARNPVSQYTYVGGSQAGAWGLSAGWRPLGGISGRSNQWGRIAPNQADGIVLLLEGMIASLNPGTVLFPEILRSELNAVRHTIEAHNRSSKLEGEMACSGGLGLGNVCNYQLRVTAGSITTSVRIDRLE